MDEGRAKSMSHLPHVSFLAIRELIQAEKLRKHGVQFSLLLLQSLIFCLFRNLVLDKIFYLLERWRDCNLQQQFVDMFILR